MATIFADTNADAVSGWLIEGSAALGTAARLTPLLLAHEAAALVTPILVDETPKGETGALAASQGNPEIAAVGDGAEITWSSDEPYTDFVLHGTGVYHEPDAHSAWDVDGLQVFEVQGTTIFATHTHHEGQHAQDWPLAALDRASAGLEVILDRGTDQLFAVFP